MERSDCIYADYHIVKALYRALHRSLRSLALSTDDNAILLFTIQTHFRLARPSRLKLRLGLHSGYTAIDILNRAHDGDAEAKHKVLDMASRLRVREEIRSPNIPPPREKSTKTAEEIKALQAPSNWLFENYPRQTVNGIRKVPSLVSANSLPMLRLGKPQALKLTGTISGMLKTRQRRWDTIERLEEESVLAAWEDEWEDTVQKMLIESNSRDGVGELKKMEAEQSGDKSTSTYFGAIGFSMRQWYDRIYAAEAKARERTERITEIVFQEQELAEKERLEREATYEKDTPWN
jgi:hypothetical protein